MINPDYSQLVLYLAMYSFMGWICEVIVCSIPEKRFINRGFLYGPYCPIYGVGAITILLLTQSVAQYPAWVFLVAMLSTSILEYLTGWAMEALFQMRWWDYSSRRFNIHGRVCLGNSVAFGAMGLLVVYVTQPFFSSVLGSVGLEAQRALASLIVVAALVDLAFTLNALLKLSDRVKVLQAEVHEINAENMAQLKARIGASGRFRHLKSYPQLQLKRKQSAPISKPGFYRLFWVFVAAGVMGFVIETVYCLAASGHITSRQGLLYGPFNQIYGFGAVLMALILPRFANKSDHWLFLGSALLGGTFEYLCSWVQEKTFHSVSWAYDEEVMSVGGRTSLMYMIFWGILGYVFIRDIYPWLCRLIDRIPKRQGFFFSWVLIILLSVDMFLSAAAVTRWHERQIDPAPGSGFAQYLDTHYPDDSMAAIYPSMEWRETSTDTE